MVYGWRTHEKLSYPYWMKNNKGITLTNGGKISFFFLLLSPIVLANQSQV
jgi:hypothetical protein